MAHDYAIRIATPNDTDTVGAVLVACYPKLMAPSYDRVVLAAALPLMTKPNPKLLASSTYYLAIHGDEQVVGCGGWTRQRPGTTEIVNGLAHIRHFATHPEWTGRGIGRVIYARCATDAAAAGMRKFECYASLNAEGFYAALGFRPVRRTDVPMGPQVRFPSLIMERTI